MDEKVKGSSSRAETVEAGAPVAPEPREAGPPATTAENETQAPGSKLPAKARSLDLNELQQLSEKKLKAVARDFDLYLHPARSRHQHILDIIRAALTGGATITAEGFVDQISDSLAMLRWPRLNFLPLTEDVATTRAVVQQQRFSPGQK